MENTIYELDEKLLELKRKWNVIFSLIFFSGFLIFLVYLYFNRAIIFGNHNKPGLDSVKGFKDNTLVFFSTLTNLSLIIVLFAFVIIGVDKKGKMNQYRTIITDFYISYDIKPKDKLNGVITLKKFLYLDIAWIKKGYFEIKYKEKLLAIVKPKELFWKIRYLKMLDLEKL